MGEVELSAGVSEVELSAGVGEVEPTKFGDINIFRSMCYAKSQKYSAGYVHVREWILT